MASRDTQLNIVIDAQNNTASGFSSLKKQLDITKVSVEGISGAMKTVGTGGVVALTGLTAFLAKSVHSYGDTQLAIAKVDATLKAMENTTRTVVVGTKEVAGALKLTGTDAQMTQNKISALNLKLRENELSLKELSKEYKKGDISKKEYKLAVDKINNSTASAKLSIQNFQNALSATDVTTVNITKSFTGIGGSFDEIKTKILEASKAVIRLGFDDEAAAVSITKLFQRTNDLNEAIRLNALAMDLSRSKSVDLETASQMISLVMSGNARALKEYGIELDETKTPMEALAQLQGMVAGQAELATTSITVQNQVLKESFANLQDGIAKSLVPLLTELLGKVTPYIEKLTEWIEKNPELTKQMILMGLALTAIVAVMLPLGLALPAIVSSITALATRFGLVAVALGTTAMPLLGIIALLGIIGVTAYKISQQWQDAWDVITIAVANSANTVQVIIEGIMNYIIDSVNWLINKVNSLISKLESVPILGKKFKDIKIDTFDKFQMERFDTGAIYNNMMDRPKSGTIGDTILNITGNNFMSDEDSAEKIGDMIMSRLRLSNQM
ncbi:MAG: hypothetical protein DU489_07040 [Nitrosomonas sp.]|uniref:hypothetical protein n=1 Tax=Nitrosomonas sp. TaxID=42353 RepID=UPI0032EC0BE3